MANRRSIVLVSLLSTYLLLISACGGGSGGGSTSNTSDVHSSLLGPNVYIFSPKSKGTQETISRIYAIQMRDSNQFSQDRYAFLFKPGTYDLDVRVGYNTQVSGLGMSPDDVTITGAVRTQDDPATDPINAGPGALNTFWRSVENLSIIPTLGSLTLGPPSTMPNTPGGISLNQNVWAVSQAAPLRRIHLKPSPTTLTPTECSNANAYAPDRKKIDPLISKCPTTLRLCDVGYSSGGFMADSEIDGLVESGSQQQWMSRNSTWTQWNNENWNMVFLGSSPVPAGNWPGTPTSDGAITDGGATPVVREKPFLFLDNNGKYFVMLPGLKTNSVGVDWDGTTPNGMPIPINDFFVVKAKRQGASTVVDAAAISTAVAQGKHVLFTPGVYYLNDSIQINRPDTIVLGLGSATLVANNGKPIMLISDVDGVKVAGITFDAGPVSSDMLLQVGEPGSSGDHSSDPTFLYDVYCRVGGTQHVGKTSSCVVINSNSVVGDNLWLWRADHGENVGWADNTSANGLIVNGAHVLFYGLAVEHFQQFQTVWNGNFGRTYFYQSEMPYDPPTQSDWSGADPTIKGFASYKVADKVTDHQAWGLGVYCYFISSAITASRAIEAPVSLESSFTHMMTFWLNGMSGSEITHIINDQGATVTEKNRKADLPQ